MDASMLGSVGRVVQEHEAKRAKNLEKLGENSAATLYSTPRMDSVLPTMTTTPNVMITIGNASWLHSD